MPKKTLMQVRHNATGLMTTCNEYLQAFDSSEFRKIVVILKGGFDAETVARIPADEVVFLGLKNWQVQFPSLLASFSLYRLCRGYRVDLVLAHRYKPALFMALAALGCGPLSLVAVVHKTYQFNTLSRRVAARFFLKPRFRFIGVSEATKADILAKGVARSAEDVLALPNCIDIDAVRGNVLSRVEARRYLGLSDEDFVIGTVGRLSPVKDQATLLRAFAVCRGSMERARLVVAGEGRLERELKNQASALGVSDAVIFTGHIPDAYRIMPAFDVFALTSLSEALGRVLLEAMTCGLPVVVTNTGGIPEVVGEAVPLYNCGDAAGIAAAFVTYYEMAESQRLEGGRLMSARVEAHFTKQVFSERLRRFISSLT